MQLTRLYFSVLLVLITYSHSLYAVDCTSAIATFFAGKSKIEKISEFKHIEKIDKLERFNNRLRNFRDPAIAAQTLKTNKKLVKLDGYILSGDVQTAERELAPLFRRMEMAHIIALRNQKAIDFLEQVEAKVDWARLKRVGFSDEQIKLWKDAVGADADTVTLLRELTHQRDRSFREMGLHYHDYRIFREHIDELSDAKNCNPKCIESVGHLINELGVHSEKEQLRFPSLLKGVERPSMDEIRASVHGSPVASLVRLKKERNAEIFYAFWALLKKTTLIDAISKKLEKIPYIFERLFKSFYDQRARELFFPEMNKILRADLKELEELLEKLKEVNALFEGDEFLVTLSRRIDGLAKDFWMKLKEQASKGDPGFLDRMLKAEKIGNRKGELSLTPQPSLINKFTLLMMAGAGVSYYSLSPDRITTTPLPDEADMNSMPIHIDDAEAEKTLEELGDFLEENESLLGEEPSEEFGLIRTEKTLRFPAQNEEKVSGPGAFTKWFKNIHWQFRGKYLWP